MRETVSDEPTAETSPGSVDRHSCQQRAQRATSGGGQPQGAPRSSADDKQPVPEATDRAVEDEPCRCRHACHRERPPSTGTAAPVIALLEVPASQASIAATSSGAIRRPSGCWPENASADSSP